MKDHHPHRYDDIINLPHHQSADRPHMSVHDRAAQFAPFAALTGHKAVIAETARLTDIRMELDEYEIAALDGRLQLIQEHISERPIITVTYFCPDDKKSGGTYRDKTGAVKKIDDFGKQIIFLDGAMVPIPDIVGIQSDTLQDKQNTSDRFSGDL